MQHKIRTLQQAQQHLMALEKMAALGGLVAGVSHEVNTPLGIAITTNSIIADEHQALNDKIAKQHLSMKDMEHYCRAVENALCMQEENLIRARTLIENFKRIAVDQQQLTLETINLKNYYLQVVATLNSILKTKQASLVIIADESINITTYPGIHAHILTNLISNSVRHGFTNIGDNSITINMTLQDNSVAVQYQDNGIGLSDEERKHVFEPFYATNRKSGGIGLGMSNIYDLITQKLKGTISVDKGSNGAGFTYQFQLSPGQGN